MKWISLGLSCLFFIPLFATTDKNCLCRPTVDYVYTTPPEGFFPKMEVAGCFCEYGGKVLLLLRNPQKPQGNTWCIPGGKLEKGETPAQAILREVREETGLSIPEASLTYCRKVFVRFPETEFVLHLFRTHLKEIPAELNVSGDEHSSYLWATYEEALKLPLIPGGGECMRLAFQEKN